MAVRSILMKLTADPSQAERGLQSFNQKLEKFTATKSERLIELKDQAARTRLTQLQERLDRLGKQEVTPAVKLQMGRTAGQIEKLQRDLKGVDKTTKTAGLSLRKLAGAAAGLGVGFAAFHQAEKAVNTTTELAHSTLLLSKNFGLTVNEASRWAALATSRGIQPTALVMGFKALSTQVHNATLAIEAGGGKAVKGAQSFRTLGISQEELVKHGNDTQWVLRHIADGVSRLPAGTERAAISAKLFGRTWTAVAPLIRGGSKSMEEQLGLAEKYGATFHGHSIKSLHEFIQAQREAKIANLGLSVTFGTEVAPALTKAIHSLTGFIKGMRDGTGAGGRFARAIRPVVNAVKSLVGWFLKHPHALTVALGAWLAYKVGALKVIALVRKGLIGEFSRLGGPASRGGAAAGGGFARFFNRRAGGGIRGFGWGGLGQAVGSVMAAGFAAKFLSDLQNSGLASAVANYLNPTHFGTSGTPTGGDNPRGLAQLLDDRRTGRNHLMTPAEIEMLREYDASHRLSGFPDGGAATAPGRPRPRHRRRGGGATTFSGTIPAIGGDAHARALRLDLSQAQREYANAVRKYGPNSSAAIRAADAVQSAQDAITADAKSGQTTTRKKTTRRGPRRIPVTPAERAELRAAQRYQQAVEAHGADSPEAKRAQQRLGVSKIGVEISADRGKLAEAIKRFGKNSEQAFKARLALTGALTRLAKANDKLKDAVHKNTAALLPKPTDVAMPHRMVTAAGGPGGGWPGGGPWYAHTGWGTTVNVDKLVMPKTAAPTVDERYDAVKLHRHLRRLNSALPA